MNIVTHNLTAMNTQRQFNINTSDKAKGMEKLSSGYRINRAADDAAGLSISEKMRNQIRGLNMGSKNTQDGISLCQVADGALAEVNSMLHRITELSVMAANDVNSDEDRQCIQDEINQITLEVDRISKTTSFNDRKIFCGGEPNKKYMPITASEISVESFAGIPIELPAGAYKISADKNSFTINGDNFSLNEFKYGNHSLGEDPISAGTYTFDYKGIRLSIYTDSDANIEDVVGRLNKMSFSIETPIVSAEDLFTTNLGHIKQTIYSNSPIPAGSEFLLNVENRKFWISGCGEETNKVDVNFLLNGTDSELKLWNIISDDILDTPSNTFDHGYDLNHVQYNINTPRLWELGIDVDEINITEDMFEQSFNGAKFSYSFSYIEPHPDTAAQQLYIYDITGLKLPNTKIELDSMALIKNIKQSNYKGIEIPPSQDEIDTAPLSLWIQSGDKERNGMYLEIDRMNTQLLGIDNLDVTTHEKAGQSITSAKKALLAVNGNRSKIGAQYNRLEYTVRNVENTTENTASAESLIRDTNMADEMVKFSTKNILEQMGHSLMAQANQLNAGVLKLLT